MKAQARDMILALLAVVGLIGTYELLMLAFFHNLAAIEVMILLQTLCICCGVAGMLILSLGLLQRWE